MKSIHLILFFFAAALSGCAKNHMDTTAINSQPTSNKPAPGDSITYLALGDSYTIGEAVTAPQSFPYQLSAQLAAYGYPVKQPQIIARTGWTTDNLIAVINSSGLVGRQYRLVTLLIGVNDQFQGLSQENYKIKFAAVLHTAITFAGGNSKMVFVLSIPDYGVTPFAGGNDASIGPQIDQFNAINKQISVGAGVNYVDITAISRQAATNPALIAPDGLHPSAQMYQLWIEQLTPLMVGQLKAGN
jgi:lysophospholipase L1-like esterase